ncbi:MAG: helix-turn-helix domain-containing protein, partial [Ruminococcus sp.]|nr:helix-turn-helix domain-containing protein [Ruminococcus sp.]
MAGGRPSKYEKLVKPRLFEISEWRRIGWTEEEIAKELGLSRRTLTQYKHLYPEFLRALKN